jgi:predicted nicotinamide N-methyase
MIPASALRQRNHLLARIHRRYQTREQLLQIGPLSVQFTSIADPDRVLDDAAAEESAVARSRAPSVPYWAELWDSAMGLAQWLTERTSLADAVIYGTAAPAAAPKSTSGGGCATTLHQGALASVLDLGCGMGLSGVCAAALGARVTFADLETLPLLFARLNSLPWQDQVEARQIDWRTDALGQNFNLILGADILYERPQWEYLDRFWNLHLSPGGLVALGEPGRQTGEEFAAWIVRRGWNLRETPQIVGPDKRRIRVLQLRRQ